nr:hypothetical protein [Tanacetum cinerariifolium]
MKEAVREAVQQQTAQLQDSLQQEKDEFLRNIDENMKNVLKGLVKTQMEILLESTSNKLMVGYEIGLVMNFEMITLSVGHKNDFVSDLPIDFQIKLSLSIGEIVTHWFTLIALSALRRSGNENMLGLVILILRSILTDLQVTPTNLDE